MTRYSFAKIIRRNKFWRVEFWSRCPKRPRGWGGEKLKRHAWARIMPEHSLGEILTREMSPAARRENDFVITFEGTWQEIYNEARIRELWDMLLDAELLVQEEESLV